MRILFDHNVPKRFRHELSAHVVNTAREMRWEKLSNGLLLQAAARFGFDALLSIDKKLQYEQNLGNLPLPVVLLDSASNALPDVIPFAPFVLDLLDGSIERCLYVLRGDGRVDRLGGSR